MLPLTFYDYPYGDSDSKVQFAVFGIPWDANSTHSHGCPRGAPTALRTLTSFLGRGTEMGFDLSELSAADFGDVTVFSSLPDKTRANIKDMVKELIPWAKKSEKPNIPVMIGGDHYCTYPVVAALNEVYQEKYSESFGVLVFDAHLDYYDKWMDEETDFHCTVTKRIADIQAISPKNVVVAGVRDLDPPEIEQAKQDKLKYIPAYEMSSLNFTNETNMGLKNKISEIIEYFKNNSIKNLYISLDIDVLDGAVAPGTGYSIPGGLTYRELWNSLKEIVKNFNIVGFDLVEVAPDMDTPSKLTQITAVKLISEVMSFINQKNSIL